MGFGMDIDICLAHSILQFPRMWTALPMLSFTSINLPPKQRMLLDTEHGASYSFNSLSNWARREMSISIMMDITGTLKTQRGGFRWQWRLRALTLPTSEQEFWDPWVEEQCEHGWAGGRLPVLPSLEVRECSLSNNSPLLTPCAGQVSVNPTQAKVIWEWRKCLHKMRLPASL